MKFENLTIEVADAVTVVTLNRPERLNALSTNLQSELILASQTIANSPARVVILRGEGRAFCAGVDISTFSGLASQPDEEEALYAGFKLGGEMAAAIEAIPQVTIAALHGFVVCGGLVLAAACDLRVAASDTVFSIPEIDLGIPLAWGGIELLLRELGPALTKELVLTCRRFSPEEAALAGFLNKVVPSNSVMATAQELAREIAAKPSLPVAITKQHIAEVLAGDTSRDDARSASEAFLNPEAIAARSAYVAGLASQTEGH